jgi:hypothetical protein
MSRRVYLLGLGLALVALPLALILNDWALSLRPGVTEENLLRIKDRRPGITLAKAQVLLGRPPNVRMFDPAGDIACWYGLTGSAYLCVDREGRVRSASWHRSMPPSPGLFARFRAWLGW